jgi:hypothetical protein
MGRLHNGGRRRSLDYQTVDTQMRLPVFPLRAYRCSRRLTTELSQPVRNRKQDFRFVHKFLRGEPSKARLCS